MPQYSVQCPVQVIDECHHATGQHPYSRIMEQHYHPAKRAGLPVPKVLGLSASLVIKSVRLDQFRAEKAALERSLDAVVETAAELSLAQFVSSAKERMVHFPPSAPACLRASVTSLLLRVSQELASVRVRAEVTIRTSAFDSNSQQTSLDGLTKDFKYFSNDLFGTVGALLELGLYSLQRMVAPLEQELERKAARSEDLWYDPAVMAEMADISRRRLKEVAAMAGLQMLDFRGSQEEKVLAFSSLKVAALARELRAWAGELRCIVFVERKLVAQALACLLADLQLPGVRGVDFAYSASAGRHVKGDPAKLQEVFRAQSSAKRKLKDTLRNFRRGEVNVLVSTNVVEEGLDIPSCNLVIKFDFPTTFRSYIQSKGRARKAGSCYLLLVEEGDGVKEANYREWQQVYKMSMEECHSRREEVVQEVVEEEFYCTGVARVSGIQAQVSLPTNIPLLLYKEPYI